MQAEADELMREAAKKLDRGWFKSAKHYQAAELYTEAALKYKLAGERDRAADSHERAAACFVKDKSILSAASAYADAADEHTDAKSALVARGNAVDLYLRHDLYAAATQLKHIAALHVDCGNPKEAIAAYNEAARLMTLRKMDVSAIACKEKVALLLAELREWKQAGEAYWELCDSKEEIRRWEVARRIMYANVCFMCCQGDLVGETNEHYASSLESKAIQSLVVPLQEGDQEAYDRARRAFNIKLPAPLLQGLEELSQSIGASVVDLR